MSGHLFQTYPIRIANRPGPVADLFRYARKPVDPNAPEKPRAAYLGPKVEGRDDPGTTRGRLWGVIANPGDTDKKGVQKPGKQKEINRNSTGINGATAPLALPSSKHQWHAPDYGMTLRGVYYQGGQHIPDDVADAVLRENKALFRDLDSRVVKNLDDAANIWFSTHRSLPKDFRLDPRWAEQDPSFAEDEAVKNQSPGLRKPKPRSGEGESNRTRTSAEELRENFPEDWSHPDNPLVHDDEIEGTTIDAAEGMVKLFSESGSTEKMAVAAQAGRAKRGWYRSAAQAVRSMFGLKKDASYGDLPTDAYRFVALLASTSPQTPVENNLRVTLSTWNAWIQWRAAHEKEFNAASSTGRVELVQHFLAELHYGMEIDGKKVSERAYPVSEPYRLDGRNSRPMIQGSTKDPKGVPDARGRIPKHPHLGASVLGEFYAIIRDADGQEQKVKAQSPLFNSWYNNVITALASSADEVRGVETHGLLTGHKVESFRRNILGNLNPSTNDVWMAAFSNVDQGRLAKAGYFAFTAKVRATANLMNQRLKKGEPKWSPAEVQETVWSFFRTLTGLAVLKDKTPQAALQAIKHSDVGNAVDFVSLLVENPDAKALAKSIGLEKLNPHVFRQLAAIQQEFKRQHSDESIFGGSTPRDRDVLERIAGESGRYASGFYRARKSGDIAAPTPEEQEQ